MPPKSDIQGLIRSTSLVASTAGDLAAAVKVPFLGQAAGLSKSILAIITVSQNHSPLLFYFLRLLIILETMNSSNDEYIKIVEQINELLYAVLSVYQTTQINGILPPTILNDIAIFTE